MIKRILLVALCACALASCGTARFYSGYSPEVAKEGLGMLDPVSAIFYLDKNNAELFSDSLSFQSEGLMEQLAYGLPLNIRQRIPMDENQREEAVAFLRYIESLRNDQMELAPIPAALDTLIEASGERYALLLFTEGMTRDLKGYMKEAVATAVLDIASAIVGGLLGSSVSYGASPRMAATHIHAVILDSQINRVVFFNRDFRDDETQPLNAEQVNRQLLRVMRNFLK